MGLIGVIPAAGKASRMGQLGASLPKALIEIEGRTLLERSLETLKSIGVSRIVVVVGHLGQKIVERVYGVEIVFQEQPLGLAHAIATANPDDDFVVLCPDNVYTDDADLVRAREVFKSNKSLFLLIGTVTPNTQRDRKSYITSAHRNYEPNVYNYRSENDNPSGLAINSTGCTFFKREALDYLPSFSNREHIFRDYLDRMPDGLIYLLRGMRYDFSEPEDIEHYLELLRRRVPRTHPHDNPGVRHTSHRWHFGGTMEILVPRADAVEGAVKESIDFDLRKFRMFRQCVQNNTRWFAFSGELKAQLDELRLS